MTIYDSYYCVNIKRLFFTVPRLFDAEERTMKQSPRNTIVGKYARYSEVK